MYRTEPESALPSRRGRVVAWLRKAAAVAGPAAVGALLLLVPDTALDHTIKINAFVTLSTISALALVALLDPKAFEAQSAAAKAVSELWKSKAASAP